MLPISRLIAKAARPSHCCSTSTIRTVVNCARWLIIPCACCTSLFLIGLGIFISACNLLLSGCNPAADSLPLRNIILLPESWQFSSFSFCPNSAELSEASVWTYYVFICTVPPRTSSPPLLLPLLAVHTLTCSPRCPTPCSRDLCNSEHAEHLIHSDNLSKQALPKAP